MMTRLPSLVTALVAAAHVARVTAQLPRDQLQLPHVAHVDTDAQLRSREPFVLRSGELYRDLLTIRTSQLAAVFARQFEAAMGPRLRHLRARTSSRLARPPPPGLSPPVHVFCPSSSPSSLVQSEKMVRSTFRH